MPTASAITQARKRLGPEVFPELFERTCGPVAGETGITAGALALGTARGSFLRGWRLLAIDGFEVDVPDSPANAAEFGYAGSGENRSAFPKARVVAMAECGTHAFVAAEVGAYSVGEKTMAARLYPRLRAEELLTADRASTPGPRGTVPPRPARPCCGGAPTQLALPVIEVLADGIYLSVVMDSRIRGQRREQILAAARAGQDLDHVQAALDEKRPAPRAAGPSERDVARSGDPRGSAQRHGQGRPASVAWREH